MKIICIVLKIFIGFCILPIVLIYAVAIAATGIYKPVRLSAKYSVICLVDEYGMFLLGSKCGFPPFIGHKYCFVQKFFRWIFLKRGQIATRLFKSL